METEVEKRNGQAITSPAGRSATVVLARLRIHPATPSAELRTIHHHAQHICDLAHRYLAAHERREPDRIRRARQFIALHLTELLTVAIVARHVNLSPAEFSRHWNQVTGLSLTEYLARLRVERARVLLRDTDGKVADIALEAGFQSHPAFYRWFGKLTGQSPKEYRRGLALNCSRTGRNRP